MQYLLSYRSLNFSDVLSFSAANRTYYFSGEVFLTMWKWCLQWLRDYLGPCGVWANAPAGRGLEPVFVVINIWIFSIIVVNNFVTEKYFYLCLSTLVVH